MKTSSLSNVTKAIEFRRQQIEKYEKETNKFKIELKLADEVTYWNNRLTDEALQYRKNSQNKFFSKLLDNYSNLTNRNNKRTLLNIIESQRALVRNRKYNF